MGSHLKVDRPALSPLFRSQTQGRLLAALVAEPEREFSIVELAARASTSAPAAGREVERLATAGLVKSRRSGNLRMVSADTTHRLYRPMAEIVTATWGLIEAGELSRVPASMDVAQRLISTLPW